MTEPTSKEPIRVSDLYVVSMPTPDKDKHIKPWPGMESLYIAEDCGRYTLVLTPEDFNALPQTIKETAEAHLREKAHHHHREVPVRIEKRATGIQAIAALAIGLEDVKANTTRADKLLYVWPQWEEYKKNYPDRATAFRTIMDWLHRDFKRVNAETDIMRMQKPTYELAARRLLQTQEGENILLIAEKTGLTEKTFMSLYNGAPLHTLFVTHPDPQELEARSRELRQLVRDKRLKVRIDTLPFDEAVKQFEKMNHVVVCMPIGAYPQHDQALIDAWKARERQDGSMVHRKGNPHQNQKTTPPWSDAGLHRFYGMEALEAEYTKIIEENKHILRSAAKQCRHYAVDRYAQGIFAQGQKRAWLQRQGDTRGNRERGNGGGGLLNR